MNISDIKELAAIMKENDLTCVEFENENGKVKLCKNVTTTVVKETAASPESIGVSSPALSEQNNVYSNADYIVSPTVGVFYKSPSPESKPYVEVGSNVKTGDVICIIEAMKMMNEIQADRDGVITEVMVKDGDLVEFDQPMFKINYVN